MAVIKKSTGRLEVGSKSNALSNSKVGAAPLRERTSGRDATASCRGFSNYNLKKMWGDAYKPKQGGRIKNTTAYQRTQLYH